MQFSDLYNEVFFRGFTYLNDASTGLIRTKRWVNEAMHEINDLADWPYLETDVSGTAPLTVADLRRVIAVADTTDATLPLRFAPREWIVQTYGSVSALTTLPRFYFVDKGNIVTIFPAKVTTTIAVRYIKNAADLSADSDVPLMPTRYQELIVQGACRRAYEDAEDWQAAQTAEADRQSGIAAMRVALLGTTQPSTDPIENYDLPSQAPAQAPAQ